MPRILTKKRIDKEFLTTKLTLVIIGLTAGSGLLIPATYASFHPVTTGEIADDTIRSADISNTAGVASADIINGQVSSVDIRDGQVGSADIGTGQVASVDILDGTITSQDIASGTIPSGSTPADNSVTSAKIADGEVKSVDIGNDEVFSVDIGDGQVGSVDIGSGQVASEDIRDGQVGSADIQADAVTTDKISDTNGVHSVDIVDGQVGSADIGDGQVTAADMADNAIDPFLQVVRTQGTVPGSGSVAVRADCPDGMDVTGGGYTAPPFVNVWSSAPFDSNTWEIHATNEVPSDQPAIAHAVCLAPMP